MATKTQPIPERFLRQLWKHQHLKRFSLSTIDGKPITVLSAGTPNTDAGPDFIDATIKIGNILYRGDVEIHQTLNEWKQHAHHTDAKYNRVILHVVLQAEQEHLPSFTKSSRAIPLLILAPYLTGPLRDVWQKMIFDERSERLALNSSGQAHIKCFSMNDDVSPSLIRSWLEKLAVERIELKVQRCEERLKELAEEQRRHIKEPVMRYGTIRFGVNPEELPLPTRTFSRHDFANVHLWEQLVYEGLMEALGYAKNREPFLRLARNVQLGSIRIMMENFSPNDQKNFVEAFLFGASGLLDVDLQDPESKRYVHELKSTWKKIHRNYRGEVLHQAEWQFFRLRPENFPTVRLAGAARLIPTMLGKGFFKSIIQTAKRRDVDAKEKFNSLESMFIIPADEFWSTHYRFGEKAKISLDKLIGKNRADDIVINAVLPICLLYARIFKDREARYGALKIFRQCPPLSENTVTRTMERELLKGKFKLNSAMLHQGAIHLYKFYCVEERCMECAVGRMVFGRKLGSS